MKGAVTDIKKRGDKLHIGRIITSDTADGQKLMRIAEHVQKDLEGTGHRLTRISPVPVHCLERDIAMFANGGTEGQVSGGDHMAVSKEVRKSKIGREIEENFVWTEKNAR